MNKEKREKIVPAVMFILVKNNKTLMEKRRMNKLVRPGDTSLPGGKINPDETKEEALKRELMEEFEIVPIEYCHIGTLPHSDDGRMCMLEYFFVSKWSGEIKNNEADELIWTDIDKFKSDIFADKLIIESLKKYYLK